MEAKDRPSSSAPASRPRVLVTGGSRGIGRAVSLELSARGYAVAFVYRRDRQAAADVAAALDKAGTPHLALQADLADATAAEAAVGRVAQDWGGIDLLVHSAGASAPWSPLRDLAAADFAAFVNADLCGFFNVLSPTLARMRAQGTGGAVVAVSSIAAQACGARAGAAAAAKAGLEALVRVAAREEGRAGIRVNAVAVGLTETDMGAEAVRAWGEDFAKRIIDGSALRRIGRPEEIAKAIAFLASAEASYVTGKILQVDGGQIIAG